MAAAVRWGRAAAAPEKAATVFIVGGLGKGERARIGQEARKARREAGADDVDARLGLAVADARAALGLVVARHAVPRQRALGQLDQRVGQGLEVVPPALHCWSTERDGRKA